MTMTDANAFLMGGGIPAAKFDTIGTSVSGEIIAQPEVIQQTDPKDGSLKFWDDNRPRMQLVVTVQTSLRDPSVVDDDGKRKFYVKAKLQEAVRNAVKNAGAPGLAIGGVLTVTYVGDGEQKSRAISAPKLYTATYTMPTAVQANDFLHGQQAAPAPQYATPAPAPAYVPPVPQAAPAAQQTPAQTAPAGVQLTPEQQAALAQLAPEVRAQFGL